MSKVLADMGKKILIVQGSGRPNGNTVQLAEAFRKGAESVGHDVDPDPPYGRYEKYPVKDSALLMTSADDNFWTFDHAVSYYRYAIVNYIGFHDRGMLLAGGCGDTNGRPCIDKTGHLEKAYLFGRTVFDSGIL